MVNLINSEYDINHMRIAGKLASEVLDFITPFIRPGITTNLINDICYKYMIENQKTISASLNYKPFGYPPFPKAICTSINDVVCHGIPCDTKLKNNDILNIDVTIVKNGYFGDTSRMFIVGSGSDYVKNIVRTSYECLCLGIKQVKPGSHIGNIGYVIQKHAESLGYSIVREYCGHGIGKVFHDEPQILHYGKLNTGIKMYPGMIFTIEPMINAGERYVYELPDKWTIKTKDGKLSAQWEHTILVTDFGYEVLTYSKKFEYIY